MVEDSGYGIVTSIIKLEVIKIYQALYRKYRPKTFDDVVGQKYVKEILKNSILNNKVNHAYMFFGPRGIGKTSIAKILSRAINCTNNTDGNPCNKCENCMISSEKECVDIIEIDAASNNGVDEIREIRNKVNLVPASLKYKVYIIDEVHMLTQGAFNALLKTLEEPPKHVIFILATTDPQKVSDTIISRCQCFSFKRISVEENMGRLKQIIKEENIIIDEEVLKGISLYSDGGLRDSLSLLDKLSSYKTDRITMIDFYEMNDMIEESQIENLFFNISNSNSKKIVEQIELFNQNGKNIIEIMNQLIMYLKDLVVDYYINDIELQNIIFVEEVLTKINEKMFDIKKTSKPYIYVEILLLQLAKNAKIISREIICDGNNTKKGENSENNNSTIKNNKIDDKKEKKEDQPKKNKINNEQKQNNNLFDTNIKEIMKIRVNNTLAEANKEEKNNDLKKIDKLNDFIFDPNNGYLVSEILNGKLQASSKNSIILSYEYDSIVNQNIQNIEQLTKVFNELTNSSKKIAIITELEWNTEKKRYIEFTKQGNKYTIKEEPNIDVKMEEQKEEEENNSTLAMFGDIVEIE